MENNEMQDAERLQEQVDELVAKAEVRAEVAKAHHEAVVTQRYAAKRDLAKFKFLGEVFTFGQNLLAQRRGTFASAEQPVEEHIIEGLEAALEELGRISRQAQEAAQRCDGSQMALKSLEDAFKDEEVQATSRARGLAVQGQRAVDVASGRTGELDVDTQVVPGPGAETAEAQDFAKEPIASP
jgi:hypothetical protein